MKTIEWTTGDGRAVKVTVDVVGRTSDHGNALSGHTVSMVATVGEAIVGYYTDEPTPAMVAAGCVMAIGRLAIRAEHAAQIAAAMAEARADQRIIDTLAAIADGDARRAEYEQGHARIVRAMAE